MGWLASVLLILGAGFSQLACAQEYDPELVGTWTTSSRSVFTGPGFYNPVSDRLTEPDHTGFSYSFTDDGWYEEAYYRAVANPTDPNCPSGVMQWQHGRYQKNSNGSLTLDPISVDGRMLESSPCSDSKSAFYTRYSQQELFQWYEIVTDPYHGVKRLNLYEFDGSPINPMYLYYYPTPQMLPTQTLNPSTTATGAASATATSSKKHKRGLPESLVHPVASKLLEPDRWWWFGVLSTGVGAVCYFMF